MIRNQYKGRGPAGDEELFGDGFVGLPRAGEESKVRDEPEPSFAPSFAGLGDQPSTGGL